MAHAEVRTELVEKIEYVKEPVGVTLELDLKEAYFLSRLLGGLPSVVYGVDDGEIRNTPYRVYLALTALSLRQPEGVSRDFGRLTVSGPVEFSA